MKKPREKKILWLVKKNGSRRTVIGLLRDQYGGCYVIGGPTGSHYTGHIENWKLKWKEYFNEGYIDVDSAKKNQLLSLDWVPPKITKKDQIIVDKILNKSK